MTLSASPGRLVGMLANAGAGRIVGALIVSGFAHMVALAWLSDALVLGRAHPGESARPALVVMLQARPATQPSASLPGSSLAAPKVATQATSQKSPFASSAASPGPISPELDTLRHAATAAPGPTEAPEFVGPFLPPTQVDQRAYPLNGPTMGRFAAVTRYSGTPIRLRLYVDADGRVVKARILEARDGDRDAALLLTAAWEQLQFVPARRGADRVASYMDVEFQLTDWLGQPLVK